MFEANMSGFAAVSHGGSIALADAMVAPMRQTPEKTWRDRLAELDLVPDLGDDIGSIRWFRGLGTLTALSVFALALLPDFGPRLRRTAARPHFKRIRRIARADDHADCLWQRQRTADGGDRCRCRACR